VTDKPLPRATVAEAKAAWESLGAQASSRKVEAKLTASGRSVTYRTIADWKRKGWPGTDAADHAAKAQQIVAIATQQAGPAAAQVTGDPSATLDDDEIVDDGKTSNSKLAERALRKVILGVERLTEHMYAQIAKAAANPDPEVAAKSLETTARSFGGLGAAINSAATGIVQVVPQMREGEMKSVPGTVEIIPPSLAQKIKSDPLRASLEAYGKAVEQTEDAVHAEPAG
jgi:hypothetical protein